MNKHVKVLQDARELITKGWTQKVYARLADNAPIHFFNKDACSFCMVGAIYRCNVAIVDNGTTDNYYNYYGIQYLWTALGFNGESQLTEWNDIPNRTVDEVLTVYDNAIVLAEKA
jgi:hypothetical protein